MSLLFGVLWISASVVLFILTLLRLAGVFLFAETFSFLADTVLLDELVQSVQVVEDVDASALVQVCWLQQPQIE